MIFLKNRRNLAAMLESGRLVAKVLSRLKEEIRPGVTTGYLNSLAETLIFDLGSVPGFKGYGGFPYSVCASVNEEIVHGFPDEDPLEDGDIVSIDFGALKDGWYGDAAFTACVGLCGDRARAMVQASEECLKAGIEAVKPYGRVGDVSYAIQAKAEECGYDVVRSLTGHGIGMNLHEEPQVPNFGREGEGQLLLPGTVIAIEPIIVELGAEFGTSANGWTMFSTNGALSAHFERTVAVLENGITVLTDF